MNPGSLIHACLDGEISPEERERLESILRDDWEARRLYLELADLHARLLREPSVSTGRITSVAARRKTRTRPVVLAILAAAAAIVVSGAFWMSRPATEDESVSSGVAMLGETMDAVFSGDGLRAGDTLVPGRVNLESGLAQIEFFSGATLLAEGRAELEVISAWEVRCLSGRIRVRVPPAVPFA